MYSEFLPWVAEDIFLLSILMVRGEAGLTRVYSSHESSSSRESSSSHESGSSQVPNFFF